MPAMTGLDMNDSSVAHEEIPLASRPLGLEHRCMPHVAPLSAPPANAAPPLPRREAADVGLDPLAVDRLIDSVRGDVDSGTYDGAVVLLARHGDVVAHEAIGSTDVRTGRAADVSDVYLLMSMTKAMTAAAVLRLVDGGQLSLDTRVAELIPEFGTKGKHGITIHHLLTHTSGVWSAFSPAPGLAPGDMGTLDTMVRAVCSTPLQHVPGAQVVYSPWAGYAILGEVARRVDGRGLTYRELMADLVFRPLGMSDTTVGRAIDDPRRVPVVLREEGEGVAERNGLESLNVVLDEHSERPSGGVFSTATDVFRFAEMLRRHGTFDGARLLSPALTAYAARNHTGSLPNVFWDYAKESRGIADYPANFGLGVYVRGDGHYFTPLGLTASTTTFGAIGGGSTGFVVDPERALTFVFLSAGFLEGLNHFMRMRRLCDLALACVEL